MPSVDELTRDVIACFLADVQQLPNESAKTHRFMALVAQLFPGSSAVTELCRGVERAVRIYFPKGRRRGSIDTYYGNAIIEFENSLDATESTALRQLREYTAAIWAEEGVPYRTLICVASDGETWKTYLPHCGGTGHNKPRPDQIELEFLRTVVLTANTLKEFWLWLTGLLFREVQTNPTTERFKFDFGATSPAYADGMRALRAAWDSVSHGSECRLKYDAWRKYLTVTYGVLATERGEALTPVDLTTLFLKHTYLASIARLLSWAALGTRKVDRPLAQIASDVLSGHFFREQRVENLVENDFFQWIQVGDAADVLSPVWERTLTQMLTYDLDRLNQDVLKGIYQELVDPKDRHDLGEYYTPDWLCEKIVAEVLPPDGFVRLLDPACGSGSFLRAAISRLLQNNPTGGSARRLRQILSHVVGIDIHPLAVTIARVTYVLAVRSLIKATSRPIQIPVYLADSLFLPEGIKQMLLGDVPGYQIRFGKHSRVVVPEAVVNAPELFDAAITNCAKVAFDHAKSGAETLDSLRAYLRKVAPQLETLDRSEQAITAFWSFTQELSKLISNGENSIWAFIIQNNYRPAMLRDRFDVVIGNPPWLSYRYIADPEYQAEVRTRAVDEYAIAPPDQRLRTQMELATVFLVHALSTFGRRGAKLAFVMPRSILSSDQHHNLRVRSYKAPLKIESYWDLLRVRPVFQVPSCVVFATKAQKPPVRTTYSLPAVEWAGTLPARDGSWEEVERHLTSRKATARLIYLGHRNALSTRPGRTAPTRPSIYKRLFHDGANVYPRNFYFVSIPELTGEPDSERLYWVETDPIQARSAQQVYRNIILRGHVEGRFIFCAALSRHVLPFVLLEPGTVILPVLRSGTRLRVLTPTQLREGGYREIASWMAEVEEKWTDRGGARGSHTATQWLDYRRKLTEQAVTDRPLVVYNASGTDISATVVERRSLSKAFIVDHKLYWLETETMEECDYLCAILNSSEVNEEIKPFQSMGLQGERDIHKKVLELPIPRFDENRPMHLELARLGREARNSARQTVARDGIRSTLARQRAAIRIGLRDIRATIDEAVARLLRD